MKGKRSFSRAQNIASINNLKISEKTKKVFKRSQSQKNTLKFYPTSIENYDKIVKK